MSEPALSLVPPAPERPSPPPHGSGRSIARDLPQIGEGTPTDEFVAWTLERFRGSHMIITTSFGMEGCALIDMYARYGVPLQVVYVDTGFFFPETYSLRDRMVTRYPHLEFRNRGSSLTPEAQAGLYGEALWNRKPDLCCKLRKVDPMKAVLAGVDVWVTSIGRSQSPTRAEVELVEWDWQFQLVKVNPLAYWDRQRVWDYVKARDVPYNELHEQGYPTLGCTHCTQRLNGALPHQYTRLGRWAGAEKTECGLHGRP